MDTTTTTTTTTTIEPRTRSFRFRLFATESCLEDELGVMVFSISMDVFLFVWLSRIDSGKANSNICSDTVFRGGRSAVG
jgi:hypothetical protein